METPGKLKGTLFGGYKKADVNSYIMDSAQSFEKRRKELEEKNEELKKQIGRLESQNDELRERNKNVEEKYAVLERERTYIADALLNAKQEAEKIVAQAHMDAAAARSALEIELEELRGRIRREKQRINELRNGAKSALEEYISRIDGIDGGEDTACESINEDMCCDSTGVAEEPEDEETEPETETEPEPDDKDAGSDFDFDIDDIEA